ncbi:MAG: hypothetical protein KKA84_07625 [Bacteroidetes bacterium]|nr:hypothetical protein [Bacteroidota bacterium]
MKYLYVKQIVEDFDRWYKIFASHTEAQEKVGLCDMELMRDAFNPNIVTCIFRVTDIEKARAFTGAPEAKNAQKESGMLEEPVMRFMEVI